TKECVYVNLASFVECLNVGSRIMIDDGELELIVIEKNTDHLLVRVQNPGIIKARKSINLPGTKVNLPSLSDKDRDFIRFAIENNIDFIAHSFVRNKEDVIAIQRILDEHKSPIKIIAKIENQEGVDNIDEILPHVYGIMVARGDLAIEVPAEKIPVIQNSLVKKCIREKKAVIIATQMLHSMIKSPRPTRAEITDIANAVFTGTDAIMLSGETAYGDYPIEAVKTMTRTVMEVESSTTFNIIEKIAPHDNDISVYLAKTAVKAVEKLNARAIITDTDTGKTARYISAFRGRSPIFAQCYSKRVMRELALNFGIYSDYMTVETSKNQFIRTTLSSLLDKKYLSPDALVAVLAGNFGKKTGPSFVEISTAGNMIASEKL
ncbi:MAG: pyruvate kinase, partial [Bacteroidales bacterium]|nr:pyruvate kinase [Bacteroidales bacterium]